MHFFDRWFHTQELGDDKGHVKLFFPCFPFHLQLSNKFLMAMIWCILGCSTQMHVFFNCLYPTSGKTSECDMTWVAPTKHSPLWVSGWSWYDLHPNQWSLALNLEDESINMEIHGWQMSHVICYVKFSPIFPIHFYLRPHQNLIAKCVGLNATYTHIWWNDLSLATPHNMHVLFNCLYPVSEITSFKCWS